MIPVKGAYRRLFGLVVLVALLADLSACSSGAEEGAREAVEDPRLGATHRETSAPTKSEILPTIS